MKIIAAVMAVLAVIYFFPAFMSRTDEINGATRESAYRSAIAVKRYLPTDERITFDTAFGLLDKLKAAEGPEAFAAAVDGLKPEEVIELAKREVNIKIATGDPAFKEYSSWEDMLRKLAAGSTPEGKKAGKAESVPLRQSERTGRPQ
ncbi:MAG: hypothetical protein FJ189_12575 [Gammaproteobacteria bacterium]|nr:hypothetical protein [Gammaproteobacteria bacterium]